MIVIVVMVARDAAVIGIVAIAIPAAANVTGAASETVNARQRPSAINVIRVSGSRKQDPNNAVAAIGRAADVAVATTPDVVGVSVIARSKSQRRRPRAPARLPL